MTRLEDMVEETPALLRLAASALARNPSAELKRLQERRPPSPTPEALFDSYRELAGEDSDDPIGPAALNPFLDAARFPLEDLNLQNCASLSDHKLARLLKAQRRSLRSLNINNCDGLTHRLAGRLRSVRLDQLEVLCLGHSKTILGSWFESQADRLQCQALLANTEAETAGPSGCQNCGFPVPSESVSLHDFALAQASAALSDPMDALEEEAKSEEDEVADFRWAELATASSSMPTTSEAPQSSSQNSADSLMEEECEEEDSGDECEEEEMPASSSGGGQENVHRLLSRLHQREQELLSTARLGQEGAMSPPITAVCPNLRALVCFGFPLDDFKDFNQNIPSLLRNLLTPVSKLVYLDLSYWEGLEDGRFLRPLSNRLVSLVLYNVPNLYTAIDTVSELKFLTKLDVSQATKETGIYPKPATALQKLCANLPHLCYLDLSSTNLPSPPSKDDSPKPKGSVRSDIVGLRALRRPLDFLGLYNCESAARLPHLPAAHVTGDGSEAQVLLSLETYLERQEMLRDVLNEVYTVYRFGGHDAAEGVEQARALHLVLEAMRRYLGDPTTQIAGSASLFYIIKPVNMTAGTRQKVVRTLLSGMEEHMEEQVMVRNCCLSLCQVEIPNDVLFDYQRAARLLIAAIRGPNIDDMTQKVVVYLLNSMACHVEGEQKSQVGRLGAVEAVLDQIRRRVDENTCDEVMEVAWSFLWNITDETPENCERFLRNSGLRLFHSAFQKFPGQKELVRNMMGLMGNIAEVQGQRCALREAAYIRIFVELLGNLEDGIEISYNSAGVLAHILSDPEWEWSLEEPTREEVGAAVVAATAKWELKQRRFINYRSFGPILRLLRLEESFSPASLQWGVWALANLTTVDGNKYCEFVRREGGEPLLAAIVESDLVSQEVRGLAAVVRANIHAWSRNELPATNYENDEEMEEVEP